MKTRLGMSGADCPGKTVQHHVNPHLSDLMTTRHGLPEPLQHPDYGDLDDLFDLLGDSLLEKRKNKLIFEALAHRNQRAREDELHGEAVAARIPDPHEYARQRATIEKVRRKTSQRLIDIRKGVAADSAAKSTAKAVAREDAALALRKRRKTAKGAAPKNPRKTAIRSPQIDKQYIDLVGNNEKRGINPTDALVYAELNKKPKLRSYKLPLWDKSSYIQRIAACSFTASHNNGYTFNVRPSPQAIEASLKSNKGPKAYFTDRVTKELRKAFNLPPEFVLIIESDSGFTQTNTFHFHGIVIVPDKADSLDKLEAAFKRAVGEWDAPGYKCLQTDFAKIDRPIGWASYILKQINRTATKLTGDVETRARDVCSISQAMSRRAKSDWKVFREYMPQPGRK